MTRGTSREGQRSTELSGRGRGQGRADVPTQPLAPEVAFGHLGHVLNEVPAAVGHEFGPPAVQCESQAPPDLLEEDGLALEMPRTFPGL